MLRNQTYSLLLRLLLMLCQLQNRRSFVVGDNWSIRVAGEVPNTAGRL